MKTIQDLRTNLRQMRVAGVYAACLLVLSLLVLPWATHPLPRSAVMMPFYQTAIGLIDFGTALLLLLQFQQSQQTRLALLSGAFFFAGYMALFQLFFFPGILGEELPVTMMTEVPARIWLISNIGFPLLFVAALFLPAERSTAVRTARLRYWALLAIVVPFALGVGLSMLAIRDLSWRPLEAGQSNYSWLIPKPLAWSMFILNVAAFFVLILKTGLKRRLELWLAVILLSMILHAGLSFVAVDRYTVAWYAARFLHLISAGSVLAVFLWEVHLLYQSMFRLSTGLREQASRDSLTKIFSRRYFERKLAGLLHHRRLGHEKPLTLMMVDIDSFKAYNDSFGHLAGDHCLALVAREIASHFRREGQFVARYGGEEFAIVLPGMGEDRALPVADRVRRAVQALPCAGPGGLRREITISIGIAHLPPKAKPADVAELIHAADMALYAAKNAGRNCLRINVLESQAAPVRQVRPILYPAETV